jgi:hypothetical protein
MRSYARHCIGIALVTSGILLLRPAIAGETAWSCWHHKTDIHCVPGFTSRTDEIDRPHQRALNDLRQIESQDSGKWIVIPLHSEPKNWGNVKLLVESVMCGSNHACTVDLNPTPLRNALLVLDN